MAVTATSNGILKLFDTSGILPSSCSSAYLDDAFLESLPLINVETISLNDIFSQNNIKECNLLKIDCEGSEYEILLNSSVLLNKKIKNMIGEFHESKSLTLKGFSPDYLENYCRKYINGTFEIQKISL